MRFLSAERRSNQDFRSRLHTLARTDTRRWDRLNSTYLERTLMRRRAKVKRDRLRYARRHQ